MPPPPLGVFDNLPNGVFSHMGSFAHPMHYFAAAGENDDFVIAVINFQLYKHF